jgi:capsular polysaccharide transport system permease protein
VSDVRDAGQSGYDPRGLVEAARGQSRAILALMIRDMILRRRGSRYFAMQPFVEPMLWVGLLIAGRAFFLREPAYGNSITLFILAGFIPFYAFVHISTNLTQALIAANAVRQLPTVTNLDVALARALVETLTIYAIAVIGLLGLAFFGFATIPIYMMRAIQAASAVALFAFGMGLLNGAIGAAFPFWGFIYAVITRLKLFLSAVFYMPIEMVEPVRTWILYSPLLHGVEWFRSAFYVQYPTWQLDTGYLLWCSFISVVIGLAVERTARRWRMR